MLQQTEGFIIDLDGTVYKGKRLIEGAAETVARLKERGKKIVFLSNRGNISRQMCHDKLTGMGLSAAPEEIMLTSTVTAMYLRDEQPGCRVWALGEQGLRDELTAHGVELADKPEHADWLVITLHETLTYAELNMAFRAVRHGAGIIATNEDKTFPGDDGDAIDVAGMIGAIVHSTGREVDLVIGKPSARMAKAALDTLGLPPERCMVIGDSLASDITLGRRAGIQTALVLTGSVKRKDVPESGDSRPDYVWESLADLLRYL
ncbi:HAD-IIA family hydrolase [Paenibacillus humicola]|uniref:HAD-IIA family hydrolase n=1 Tax=Paenibacillus humicola TaxID=3110540 RepID=UPI00237A8394|nr:HAD-IIA family hydrolase [Paenibacillus humicola]